MPSFWRRRAYAAGLHDGRASAPRLHAAASHPAAAWAPAGARTPWRLTPAAHRHAEPNTGGAATKAPERFGPRPADGLGQIGLPLPILAPNDLQSILDAAFDDIALRYTGDSQLTQDSVGQVQQQTRLGEAAAIDAALQDVARWHQSLQAGRAVHIAQSLAPTLRCPISHLPACSIAHAVAIYTGHVPRVYEARDALAWMQYSLTSAPWRDAASHPCDRTRLTLDMLLPVLWDDAAT